MFGNIRFLMACHRLKFKVISSYRLDVSISFAAALLHDAATLLFLSVVFAKINLLQGWTFNEMIFIWGFAVIARNIGYMGFDVLSNAYLFLGYGEMDRALVRPRPLIIQMASVSGFNIFSIGRTLIGAAAIAYALQGLHLEWWAWIYLPVAVVSASLIQFGLDIMIVSLGCFFVQVGALGAAIGWIKQFGQYPTNIFSPPLQVLFTWVLPYAMMGFIPAAFVIRGSSYLLLGLMQPAVGIVFLVLGLLAWRVALRHYSSTGS